MNRRSRPDRPERRRFLGWLAVASTVPAAVVATSGCGVGAPDDGAVPVALADLAPGSRRVVRVRDTPVEVLRTEDGVRALSLLCTHFSCTVRWDDGEGRYVCPCHDGRFDADGRPVSGPPDAPLRSVPFTLDEGTAWIGRG